MLHYRYSFPCVCYFPKKYTRQDGNTFFFGFVQFIMICWTVQLGYATVWTSPSRDFVSFGGEFMVREHARASVKPHKIWTKRWINRSREKFGKNKNEERKAIYLREKHTRYCITGIFFYAFFIFRKITHIQMKIRFFLVLCNLLVIRWTIGPCYSMDGPPLVILFHLVANLWYVSMWGHP